MIDIFISIGLFFAYFFANPLLYLGFAVIYWLSAQRVKQEREAFHTRVYGRVSDWVIPFVPALLTGLGVSVITVGLGIVLTLELILILSVLSILVVLTFQVRWMTPAFVLGALLLFYGSEPLLGDVELFAPVYEELSAIPLFVIASLLALLVIAEGTLIRTNGMSYTSPKLVRSKRGKWIGLHETKRLWIVPIIFFVPEGMIPAASYWPILPVGEGGWQPVLLPFLIGFHQQVRATVPTIPMRTMGLRVMALGILFAILAVGSYYVPFLAVVLGGLAIVSRELLWVLAKARDERQPAFFSSLPKGCIVLGILPGSPADKMKIEVGEVITKVNGQAVNSEESFYEALQLNSAFCKLDVLNRDGEVRFAQGALYDGEHHQLGVLLVKDDVELQDSII